MNLSHSAKITPPELFNVSARERLFKLLDQSVHPVIWISSPGGSGKSTLVASWFDSLSKKKEASNHIWYSVDKGDTDKASFFYYMGLALKKAVPQLRKELPLLTSQFMNSTEVFTRKYFELLFEILADSVDSSQQNRSLTETKDYSKTFIVLDNYQDVDSESTFHDMIVQGLASIRRGIRVIIISRNAPPPQYARLLANNIITRINFDQIRFTINETKDFIRNNRKMDQNQEGDKLAEQLNRINDGWAAGMVLMLNSSESDFKLFDMTKHETIFNYFATEIFNESQKDIQAFLLQTSFFISMTKDMAKSLTGFAHSEEILSDLYRNNYFCQLHAGESRTYQYHPLFQLFLMEKAVQTYSPAELQIIRRNAAVILEKSGQTEQAARLFQEGEEYENLIKLIKTHAIKTITEGRGETLEKWIGFLPDTISEKNPWILYWRGVARGSCIPIEARGDFEKSYIQFREINDALGLFRTWIAIIDTFVFNWGNLSPLDHWISVGEHLITDYPEFLLPELYEQVAMAMLKALLHRQPNHPEIGIWEERVREVVLHSSLVATRIAFGINLVHYYLYFGDYNKSSLLVDILRPLSSAAEIDPLSRIQWYTMEAYYFYLTADLESNKQAVQNGLIIIEESGIHLMDIYLLTQGVMSGLTLNDPPWAKTCLDKMNELPVQSTRDKLFFHDQSASVALYLKDYSKAIEHGKFVLDMTEQGGGTLARTTAILDMASILFEAGRREEAHKMLIDYSQNMGKMKGALFGYFLMLSRFNFEMGQTNEGLSFLKKALSIGAEHGFVNCIRWNNSYMSRLCAIALKDEIEISYVRMLILRRDLVAENYSESWPYLVRINTLNKFELYINDKAVKFTGKIQQKPLTLLKLLIALGGKDVPISQISDTLWPDSEGDHAYNSFAVTLTRLRKIIKYEAAIDLSGGKVSLNEKYIDVDIWRLEKILESMENCDETELEKHANTLIIQYQGKFLPGDNHYPSVNETQMRLSQKIIRSLIKFYDYLENQKQCEKGIPFLEKALLLDNCSEGVYQRLMLCNFYNGRSSDAVKLFTRCSEQLRLSLDVEPSLKTKEIYNQIIASQAQ